ncbi:MAG: indolepyruvate oxidoreductase subunit beta [Candidatus Thermoplasmatota archaeon]|nr:indolepyruvate oxidoreductase subunit beta [Candidatus Thermoplasmatota archaeon]
MKETLDFIFAGVGGQGSVIAARMIGDAAIEAGYRVAIGETHGAGQRGGSVLSHVRLWKEGSYGPLIMDASADVVLGLEPFEALKSAARFLKDSGTVVTSDHPILPPNKNYPSMDDIFANAGKIAAKIYALDATQIAKDAGDVASLNIVVIGAAFGAGVLPINEEILKKTIAERFPKAAGINLNVFELGKKMVKQRE